ncbi:MAG: peptidoglycan-associated lipoprotein Pal [Alphaproteobacteria bacterium]|nr:peptidoglycan-associated lipoprotein Pal [Alphaproteobacteria bacterium]
MNLKLAGVLTASLLALAACSSSIPNSGANGSTFKANSPEYFATAIGDRVLFALDQTTLTAGARSVLDGQAAWMTQNTAYSALIEGHADERGTRAYNLALGARRASAVETYLVNKGVADSRLSTVTYGKERPIAVCSNESCWSQNRRAVTVLSAGNI